MATVVKSFAIAGIDGYPVDVEVDILPGPPAVSVVGLGDAAIKEARDRLESALLQCAFDFPRRKVLINLAPSHVKKSGTHFDLAMAIALLIHSQQSPALGEPWGFIGALSLNAELRHVHGILPMAAAAKKSGVSGLIVPAASLAEASLVHDLPVYGFRSLPEVLQFLGVPHRYEPPPVPSPSPPASTKPAVDFADVQGQDALMPYVVAVAAGGHNFLMSGSPGCGKSMIAQRMPTILPPMSEEEALEVTKIHSVAGKLPETDLIRERPFRTPHHNASVNALIGGGTHPGPGEISLAHNGVLFLDEVSQFAGKALEALRQPLEDQTVTISRVKASNTYPCRFMLIAATNPCPCGHYGHEACQCRDSEILRYRSKISGPILDRIDIQKNVAPLSFWDLTTPQSGTPSRVLREQVLAARQMQQERFRQLPGVHCNAQIPASLVKEYCVLETGGQRLLQAAFERFQYSARTYHKFLRIARTFADLDGAPTIRQQDVSAALLGRDLDKETRKLMAL